MYFEPDGFEFAKHLYNNRMAHVIHHLLHLVLGHVDLELFELVRDQVPVVLPCGRDVLVLDTLESRVKGKWLLALLHTEFA